MALSNLAHPCAWHETSPGHWERLQNGMEAYFATFAAMVDKMTVEAGVEQGAREQWMVHSSVSFDPPNAPPNSQGQAQWSEDDLVKVFKDAWIRLRFAQPAVASTADSTHSTAHYIIPASKADVTDWLNDTFHVVADTDTATYYPDYPPAHRVHLYYFPQSSELTIRCPHWVTDGVGNLQLFSSYLEVIRDCLTGQTPDGKSLVPIDSLGWGTETARLTPSLEAIFDFPTELTDEQRDKGQQAFSKWAEQLPGQGLPSTLGTSHPTKCQKVRVECDEATTAAVLKACKERDMTVTTALMGAYALAIEKTCDPAKKSKSFTPASAVDLRPLLPEPYNSTRHACALAYTVLPMVIPTPATFESACKMVEAAHKPFVDAKAQTTTHSALLKDVAASQRQFPESAMDPEFMAPATDGSATSLGVVDKYLDVGLGKGGLTITDFSMAIEVFGGMSAVHWWTAKGKLSMMCSYNQGQWKKEDTLRMCQETMKQLKAALNVP